jgi:hypothetical protein
MVMDSWYPSLLYMCVVLNNISRIIWYRILPGVSLRHNIIILWLENADVLSGTLIQYCAGISSSSGGAFLRG